MLRKANAAEKSCWSSATKRRLICRAKRRSQSHGATHCCEPGASAWPSQILRPRLEDFRRFVRSHAREVFAPDAFALENCSARLVSTNREVDRAHNDPRNFAALRLAKEMYRRARALSAWQWNYASRHNRRRL